MPQSQKPCCNISADKRDRFIDIVKGIAILWVIHIHTVFLSGEKYIPELVKQLSLFLDIPVFFFIAGYLNGSLAFFKSVRRTGKQIINLYFEYLVISLLLICITILFGWLLTNTFLPSLFIKNDIKNAVLTALTLNPAGNIWSVVIAYGWSIWFLRVFISILLLVPLLTNNKISLELKVSLLVFILIVFSISYDYPQVQKGNFAFSEIPYILFYLFFYIAGSLYKKIEYSKNTLQLGISLVVNIFLAGLIFHLDGNSLILQSNKFPPQIPYLIYSLISIHLICILKRRQISRKRALLFFEWCGKNVFIMYLFQGAVCSLPLYFVPKLAQSWTPFPLYLFVLLFNMSLTLTLTLLYLVTKKKLLNLILSCSLARLRGKDQDLPTLSKDN